MATPSSRRRKAPPAARRAPARRSYPRNPPASAAPRRRRRVHRNPPFLGPDTFRDAAGALAGFVAVAWTGNLVKKAMPSGFLSTPAGQAAVQATAAIIAGQVAGKVMSGSRTAVLSGGMVAAGRSFLSRVGIPGLSGLGAGDDDELSAKDLAEIQLLAKQINTGQAGLGLVDDDDEEM